MKTDKKPVLKVRKMLRKRRRKRRVLVCAVVIPVTLLAACAITFFTVRAVGKARLKQTAVNEKAGLETETAGTGKEIFLDWNGQKYRYNEDIFTILCLGIDTTEKVQAEGGAMRTGGQSDAIFLLALDSSRKKMSVIGIPRDTMAELMTYDSSGEFTGIDLAQITLQYAYGDGGRKSCELTKQAVSNLMYQLPIHGYVSVNMEAITVLNDQVGGVTVPVIDEFLVKQNPGWELGQSVTLMGEEAFSYVHDRDITVSDTAGLRLKRQKLYLLEFVKQAKSAIKKNPLLALEMYSSVTDYMVTDIEASEAAYLAGETLGCSFGEDNFYLLKGEVRQGEVYEEFYADEEALKEMLVEIFCLPAEE